MINTNCDEGEDFLNIRAVPPVPLHFTINQKAVDALTFYTGVRNRHIERSQAGIKMPAYDNRRGFPPSKYLMKCTANIR